MEIANLPSRYGINQVVAFQLDKQMPPYNATIRAIHFTASKVKYDLGIWLNDPEHEARIYNVDSDYVHDAFAPTLDELAG